MQQELQVLFAAVFEEVDDFFVLLHGSDDLGLFERARVVLVDHNKALPGSLRAGPSVTYAKASDAGSRAFRNSLVNLAISFAAALAWASRALARCASLFRSAVSIASSLRGTPTGEPRRRHRRVEVPPPPSSGLRNAPLVAVDLAVAVRVQLRERRLEARRHQQVLQILIAAVREEVDHFFICSDRCDAAGESGGE